MSESSSGHLEDDLHLHGYSDSFESSGGGADVGSEKESPAGNVTVDVRKIKSGKSVEDVGSEAPGSKKPPPSGNVRFKQVARTVQNVQSVMGAFQSSREVRDLAHKDWLARKEANRLKESEHRKTERRKEELAKEEKRKREMEKLQKSAERHNQWEVSMKANLQARAKERTKELKKKEQEEKERHEKLQEGREAAEMWRKEHLKEVARAHKRAAKQKQEEDRRKLEEEQGKEAESKKAFQCWKKNKDTILKEKAKKVQEEEQQKTMTISTEKTQESKRVVDQWLTKKSRELKASKTLYTYKEVGKTTIHEKAWRPARSVQYSYPRERLSTCSRHSQQGERNPVRNGSSRTQRGDTAQLGDTSLNSTHSIDSYKDASFESEDTNYPDSPHKENSYEEGPYRNMSDPASPPEESPLTMSVRTSSSSDSSGSDKPENKLQAPVDGAGTLKSIHVCCQVLQYWCTCKN